MQEGRRTKDSTHSQYTRESMWYELSAVDGLLCRGRTETKNTRNLQEWLVKMVRQRIWFLDLDRLVEWRIGSYLACQAAKVDYKLDPSYQTGYCWTCATQCKQTTRDPPEEGPTTSLHTHIIQVPRGSQDQRHRGEGHHRAL